MRRTKRGGGFFLCLLLNVLLNWEGALPAALLLALHRWRGWPLWWAGAALALWLGGLIVWMLVLGWASDCSSRSSGGGRRQPPPRRAAGEQESLLL